MIFPNPVENRIHICGIGTPNYSYQLFNAAGAILKERILKNSYEEINVDQLKSGFYYVRMEGSGILYKPIKFVKK